MRTISQLIDMNGRTALITGGAGHLGRAMASALVENGCNIILVDRNEDALVAAADNVAAAGAGNVVTVCTDLESQTERDELISFVLNEVGTLDVLVNNAGFVGDSQLSGWAVPFDQQSVETWRRAIEVNLTAPFHLAQSLAAPLRSSGRGVIVNVGSIYGVLGADQRLYEGTLMGNPGAYAASKGGLTQMTRWLATTLAPAVRVNCISPGGISRGQTEVFIDRYVYRTPLGRMGTEEDFKGAILFLASDMSAWMTGQNILVDGGWSAW